jgi:prepilin-type N-terminal cleavage/methylation domain-containing protein
MGMENRHTALIRRGEQGFSLIEVLIASGILLMVALGVLPIFAQAIVNNRAGADYTQATNYAKSELERLYALPFSHPDLKVLGEQTQRVQYFSQAQQKWIDGEAPTADPPLWTRTTLIRQYGVGGLVDFDKDGTVEGSLPEGTPETFVHVKEIEVRVESGRSGGPLGAGKRAILRVYKSF